jgi:hypothetical protein
MYSSPSITSLYVPCVRCVYIMYIQRTTVWGTPPPVISRRFGYGFC